ncbi:hypothetical protein BJX99DRAFT_257255 [Aspergillus californicus]
MDTKRRTRSWDESVHFRPRKVQRHNPKQGLRRRDPFKTLCFDCASLILEYLGLRDLARCEQVNRGWRDLIHVWISISGLRLHFPAQWDIHTTNDVHTAARIYRECAVPYFTLRSGRPTGARTIEASSRLFAIAGDFAAWISDDSTIYWQDLSYRHDGSFHPIQELEFIFADQILYLDLNAQGYLLVRTLHMGYTDYIIRLQTGRTLWSRITDPGAVMLPYHQPLPLGRRRVYYLCREDMGESVMAFDIDSGRLLYKTPLEDARLRHFHIPRVLIQRALSKSFVKIVHVGEREFIVAIVLSGRLERSNVPTTTKSVLIIKGDDGTLLQKIKSRKIWSYASLTTPTLDQEGQFAIQSHSSWRGPVVNIQKFTWNPETHIFDEERTETICLFGDNAPRIPTMAIDAYRGLGGSVNIVTLIPEMWPIIPFPRGYPAADRFMTTYYPSTVGRIDGIAHEITIPPQGEGARYRRLFVPNWEIGMQAGQGMRFVDGDRVVLKSTLWEGAPDAEYQVFDFGFRPFASGCGEDSDSALEAEGEIVEGLGDSFNDI